MNTKRLNRAIQELQAVLGEHRARTKTLAYRSTYVVVKYAGDDFVEKFQDAMIKACGIQSRKRRKKAIEATIAWAIDYFGALPPGTQARSDESGQKVLELLVILMVGVLNAAATLAAAYIGK